MNFTVKTRTESSFEDFLQLNDYALEKIAGNVYRAEKAGELPVFLNITEDQIFFEVDLGNISTMASEELYFKLLDLNTEILPVSFGINNSNPEDPRLVLVESRETKDLDDNELLSVFTALELAVDKAEEFLQKYV